MDWPETTPESMEEALEMLLWLPTPTLVANPPATEDALMRRALPASYGSLLREANGLRHPNGDYAIVGTDPVDNAMLLSAWWDLEAEALRFVEEEYGDDYADRAELLAQHWHPETAALLPIGRTDTGGVWLLDLEDPADPDPIVYRAEIASVSVTAAHVSLSEFLVWLVCRAHCETREDYARLADLMGE